MLWYWCYLEVLGLAVSAFVTFVVDALLLGIILKHSF